MDLEKTVSEKQMRVLVKEELSFVDRDSGKVIDLVEMENTVRNIFLTHSVRPIKHL